MTNIQKIILIFVVGLLSVMGTTRDAQAQCRCETMVLTTETREWRVGPGATVPRINKHVTDEFKAYRSWFISVFWEDNLLPALQLMAEQLSVSSVQQTQAMGTFMDGRNQLQTQQDIQVAGAQAMKDYKPSNGVCQIGSSVKSLANSERRSEFNSRVLSQRSIDRQLGKAGSSGAYGALDQASRAEQINTKFSKGPRQNLDTDFTSVVDGPWTINFNATGDGQGSNEDSDAVFALSENLYSNELLPRPGAAALAPDPSGKVTDLQIAMMDGRAVIAKRSVAENSYNAITAMKAAGSAGSRDFMSALLKELGVPEAQVTGMMGDNPSYYAQMEVLTKKIFQSPNFYTSLYDTPANVKRKQVALQAIGLMQKFDMYKSHLRSEASLSVLLELAVQNLQDEVEGEINPQGAGGTPTATPGGGG